MQGINAGNKYLVKTAKDRCSLTESAVFFTTTFISILLTGYGLNKTALPQKRAMAAIIAGVFVAMSVFGMYFTFIAKDIIQIFVNILNI